MNCYATLFLPWLRPGHEHLEYLRQKGLKPELGFDYGCFEMSAAEHRRAAAMLADHGLGCAVHLPYTGLAPGSADSKLRQKAADLLCRAAEMADWYQAEHLIGHPEFRVGIHSLAAERRRPVSPGPNLDGPAHQPGPAWLERSAACWRKVLDSGSAKLHLENTDDYAPTAIMALLEKLPEDRAMMCLDLGHWFSAADGHRLNNLGDWLERASGRLGHLHLHDNNGYSDQHLGMGQGAIKLMESMRLLEERRLAPTFTLEAHSRASLDHSLAWLKERHSRNAPLPLAGL